MFEKQRTINKSISISGLGLHTGNPSTITFHPAPIDYGYKFLIHTDNGIVEIPALVEYVVDLSRGTTLGLNGVLVHTVEHVLASLAGLRIDNCKIELSSNEPPVGDGSAIMYVEALLEAGIVEQEAKREYFIIDETIRYTNESKGVDIVALPTDDYRITVMIDYYNPALGSQHTGLFNLDKEFVTEFASARTFCFLTEIQMLLEQGLIRGGSLDSAICIVDKELTEEEAEKLQKRFNLTNKLFVGSNGILNNTKLRFKNEPARHKLLDMLGDLSLCGFPIKAQILAARPGHASNIEFVKKIRALYKKKLPLKKFTDIKAGEPALNINALLDIMPHRYPFLMIDRILEVDLEKKKIVGLKNVTFNEPYFIGHFPEKPIMPGVLQIEAMAQTGCLLIALEDEDFRKKLVFFLGIKNAKFRKTVLPGDQLIIEVEMTAKKLNASWFKAVSYVNNQVVAESEFQAIIVDRKSQ